MDKVLNIKIPPSVIDDLNKLTGGGVSGASVLSLVAGDADNIKGYLYDSPALPEIRGASVQLYKLNETGIKGVLRRHGLRPQKCLILFSAGGGFIAVVPKEKAQAIAADIERLYLDRTGVATITTAIVDLLPGDAVPQISFGQVMAHVAHTLRRKKLNQSRVPFYATSPFARRCSSCHLRPIHREDEKLELCIPCKLKRQAGIQKKRDREGYDLGLLSVDTADGLVNEGSSLVIVALIGTDLRIRIFDANGKRVVDKAENELVSGETLTALKKQLNPLPDKSGLSEERKQKFIRDATSIAGHTHREEGWSPYRKQIRKRLSNRNVVFPDTLRDIAECSTRKGYIAVVAADGNGVGNEFFKLLKPSDYRSFSHSLLLATEEVVFGTLAEIANDSQSGQTNPQMVPVEVIVTGGDDALFVVPCQYGLRAAIDVCGCFASKTRESIGKPLTMSAGVIIAPVNYPMYFLEQMAAALLSSAKRAREENEGCIDFWFLRGHGMMGTDPLALRHQMLEPLGDSHTRLQFHERPYTLARLEKLVRLAESFLDGDFPRSRLYGLRQALEAGREHATLFFHYQLARSKKGHQELLAKFQAEFISGPGGIGPWNQKRVGRQLVYSSPLADLVDVSDLLGDTP